MAHDDMKYKLNVYDTAVTSVVGCSSNRWSFT